MNEKEAIEKAIADAFIELHNSKMGTSEHKTKITHQIETT